MLSEKTGAEFLASQTYCGVAGEGGKIYGLYILHPNGFRMKDGRYETICPYYIGL